MTWVPWRSGDAPIPTIHRTLAARSSGRVAGSGPEGTPQQTRGGASWTSHAPGGGWMTREVQKWDLAGVCASGHTSVSRSTVSQAHALPM